jgi:hypothetical protein
MTLASLVALVGAADAADKESATTAAETVEALRAVKPHFVKVEYWLQMDKGQEPDVTGWGYRCPNCGGWHYDGGGGSLEEQRPMETMGVLIADDKVLTADVMTEPRFIRRIEVRQGDALVTAQAGAIGRNCQGRVLKLDKPLPGARPAGFDAQREGPYLVTTYSRTDGRWTLSAAPLSTTGGLRDDGTSFASVDQTGLVVDKDGKPVGMIFGGKLSAPDAWKGDPLTSWDFISASDYDKLLDRTGKRADAAVLRVVLNFRSPRKEDQDAGMMPYDFDDEDTGGTATEKYALGLLLSETRLLVLSELAPKTTARLERIRVHTAEGKVIAADFDGSLREYGAFFAELREPLPGAVKTSDQEGLEDRRLLPTVTVTLRGGQREARAKHTRFAGSELGFRSQLNPDFMSHDENSFVFRPDGRLLSMPLGRRRTPGDSGYGYYGRGSRPVYADRIDTIVRDLASAIDTSNRPLSEAEEARLAWMGVQLQPMTPELAKANKVSHLLRGGRTGGIVSFVYPDSPADKAGVKVDDILMTLHLPDRMKPIEVTVESRHMFGASGFPWEQLDNLPEHLFDRVPKPWPALENSLTRTLTDLGFGREYTAKFFRDGEVIEKDFTVVESPEHYEMAPKHKCEPLGVTLRDLTFEVRRYFQMDEDDPGLIITRLEPGSKGAVGGLRPYEIVREVNGKPVATLEDFAKAVAGQKELRLAVKRMTRNRVLRIELSEPIPALEGDNSDSERADDSDDAADSPDPAPATED